MKSNRYNLIVIVGPTASGKSKLAVRLARKFSGEIISADSRQVYRGLDIGTGKITKDEMQGVSHHLIDVADPRRQFSVVEFQHLAEQSIRDITRRGKLPFLVGGTGFWVDAVARGLRLPAVPPNKALRKRLGKKNARELFRILKRLDPARARTIERQNPRRLIRAIEIARAIGRTPNVKRRMPYRLLWIGLHPKPGALKARIERRIAGMLRAGLILETTRLLGRNVSPTRIREFGFEYRTVLDYLSERISRDHLAARIVRDSVAYARRQLAWFRKNRDICWVKNAPAAERLVRRFLLVSG